MTPVHATADGGRCGACARFLDDPRAFESALPGFAALSSAYGSVRAETGLCLLHDDLRLPTQGCAQWCAKPSAPARANA